MSSHRSSWITAALCNLLICAAVHAQSTNSGADSGSASPQGRSRAYTSFDNPYAPGAIYDPYRGSSQLAKSTPTGLQPTASTSQSTISIGTDDGTSFAQGLRSRPASAYGPMHQGQAGGRASRLTDLSDNSDPGARPSIGCGGRSSIHSTSYGSGLNRGAMFGSMSGSSMTGSGAFGCNNSASSRNSDISGVSDLAGTMRPSRSARTSASGNESGSGSSSTAGQSGYKGFAANHDQ